MAALKLWEEEKLDLKDPVIKYFANFPYKEVTIEQLLSHRSGLPDYTYFMEPNKYKTVKVKNKRGRWVKKLKLIKAETPFRQGLYNNQDVLDYMVTKRPAPAAMPNRVFKYCNTNFVMLALIIEKVSGMSFSQYLTTTFFEPLEMKHTFVFTPEMEDKVMPSYNWKSQKEPFMYLDGVYGDKNIYSTPRDMLKWDSVLTYGKMFKPETLEAAYRGYSNEKRGIKNYGLGWRLYLYPNNKKIIYHNGWWHGNNTFFSRMVEDSVTIIVLGNKFNKRIYDARKLYVAFGNPERIDNEEE
jgi:CubicO group peptidase (beta-lactamase class C family)